MMYYLYLLRHAKSDWSKPWLTDFERPLNARGLRNGPYMARLMQQQNKNNLPTLMLCSPALRTKQTAEFFCQVLPSLEVRFIPELYLATSEVILIQIQKVPTTHNTIMVCGHNPGLTQLINWLQPEPIENLPTCSWVLLGTPIEWQYLTQNCATLLQWEYPKKYETG
ncbi:MAG: histidine phosphatase family protein [Bacteroidia bacterium]|nr:histidine phosphatase family protein [Bacteroidia bacterium]MDW8159270.1 histidine phosphatase family protein [Bacteroidia bacterium]